MSAVSFSKSEFEQALVAAVRSYLSANDGSKINYQGLIKGEHVYAVLVGGTNKAIFVRSSVKGSGVSAGTGEDSIRLWISSLIRGDWVPMGKVTYTQRTEGWESRMASKFGSLVEKARGIKKSLPTSEVKVEKKSETPTCPKCGSEMVLRTARRGKNAGNQFWGCSTFPKCRETVDVKKEESKKVSAPKAEINWSEHQKAIFQEIETGTGNLVIEAVAGSGKTTTIVKGLEYTPKDAEVRFVAFNTHIAKELAQRVPGHVSVSTLHSLGNSNIRNAYGRCRIDAKKVPNMIRDYAETLPTNGYEVIMMHRHSIAKLVSLVKGTMTGSEDADLMGLCSDYNVDVNDEAEMVFQAVRVVLVKSRAETSVIDFDDMIDFCATGKVPCEQFDVLFGDEVQDWNAAQIEMALRSVKSEGRIIGVGDRWQSIYGFRGADINAIPNLIKATDAKVLPLSITYRCPASHVEIAKTLVPHIEAREDAPDGKVESVNEFYFAQNVEQGDMVLCRCNAPLVKPAFNLIRQGKKAVILGRDIGRNLLQMVYRVQKKYKVHTLEDTLEALISYARKETAKLVRMERTIQAENLMDRVDTVVALSDGCETVREVEEKVQTVFSDNQAGVTFSSVHKAKGGEADRVWILQPGLMPHPKAQKEADIQQERNIKYVAFTRSKSELYLVG